MAAVVSSPKYVVALDVGGTSIAANVVSNEGGLLLPKPIIIDTPSGENDPSRSTRTPADVIEAMALAASNAAAMAQITPSAIGVSMAGPCIERNGTVLFDCLNIWAFRKCRGGIPTDVAQSLAAATKLPVAVENDANAFAIGEYRFGAARGSNNLIAVVLGSGVGAGIIADGRILHTSTWNAGEIHHIPIAIPRSLAEQAFGVNVAANLPAYPSNEFVRVALEPLLQTTTLKRIFGRDPQDVAYDDPTRLDMITFVADWLSWGLASALQTVSASVLVIGGGAGEGFGMQLADAVNYNLRQPPDDTLSPNWVAANGHVMTTKSGTSVAAFLGVGALAHDLLRQPDRVHRPYVISALK